MNKIFTEEKNHYVAIWLFACAFMIFMMVVIGGLTRLTESGLSIVEWKPVAGTLPPIGEQEWEVEFAQYRTSPEYMQKNYGMTLSEFKAIFWLEYIHRLIGRLIGFVFLLPYLYFLIRKDFSKRQAFGYLGIFFLGGLQGVVGWYMVKSGLAHDPRVSPYRLALHLAMAVFIFGIIFVQALGLWGQKKEPTDKSSQVTARKYFKYSLALTGLIFFQMMLGALVAGNDAGLIYNTFPTMDGHWLPEGAFARTPLLANFFENPSMVQFMHRIGAYTVAFFAFLFWWKARKNLVNQSTIKMASNILIIFVFFQFLLGVMTLIHQVPVGLASPHQAMAVLVFAVSLFINRHLYVMVRASK